MCVGGWCGLGLGSEVDEGMVFNGLFCGNWCGDSREEDGGIPAESRMGFMLIPESRIDVAIGVAEAVSGLFDQLGKARQGILEPCPWVTERLHDHTDSSSPNRGDKKRHQPQNSRYSSRA